MLHRHDSRNSHSVRKNIFVPCVKRPVGEKARSNRAIRRMEKISPNIDWEDYVSPVANGKAYTRHARSIELDEYLEWRDRMVLSNLSEKEAREYVCK